MLSRKILNVSRVSRRLISKRSLSPHPRSFLTTTTATTAGRKFVTPATAARTTRPQLKKNWSKRYYSSDAAEEIEPRESDEVDVCIVGGGPSGLAAAIKLKQLDLEHGSGELRVVLLEKAPDMGAHILSGAVLEPTALDELLPEWKDNPPSPLTPVTSGSMKYLTKSLTMPLPEPPQMHNNGNYIVSLNQFVKWLAEQAEELGVEIYPGFAVSEVIYDEETNSVKGIATNDMGVSRNYEPKHNFERGMEFHAKTTLFAEGCHGSLTKELIKKYNLRENSDPQTYGIGLKEVWEVPKEKWTEGYAAHSMGYPISSDVYGGGFQYHFGENLVSVGLVVGLDYANPWISPYQEFQKMKHHPFYADVLKDGKCLSYGARALNEGGFQSIPKLTFPGGALIGCTAGFLNVPKIKGTHTAMKSGMLAAEAAFEEVSKSSESGETSPLSIDSYEQKIRDSWVWKELHEIRNIRPSFNSPLKFYGGLLYSGLDTLILKGKTPWTFHHKHTDAEATKPAEEFEKIEYPKPDGQLSFDILTSVSRTGTYHDEDEPVHLKVDNWDMHTNQVYPTFKGIENRFCPAGVYEYVEDESKPYGVRFQINSQNCIHCKTCDIKVPSQDINWSCPEGGDGPKYYMT